MADAFALPALSTTCSSGNKRSKNQCLVPLPLAPSLPDESTPSPSTTTTTTTTAGIFGDFAEELFEQLAVAGAVGWEELRQWEDLQALLQDGDLSQQEVQEMVAEIATKNTSNHGSSTSSSKLDEAGFVRLYEKIDDLFVYEEDRDSSTSTDDAGEIGVDTKLDLPKTDNINTQAELLSCLTALTQRTPPDLDQKMYRLPCGMECSEEERTKIATLVADLELSPDNLLLQRNGNILVEDVLGEWELLYTNSKAMIVNKSLSGLMGSPGNKAEFGGVRQRYTGSK